MQDPTENQEPGALTLGKRVPWDRFEAWALPGLLLGLVVLLGALTAKLPMLALLGSAAIVGFFALLVRPEFAAAVVAFLLWANVPVVAMRDHGVPKTLAALYLLLFLLPIGKALLIDKQHLTMPRGLPWLGLFVGFSVISAAFSRDATAGFDGVQELILEGALVFALAAFAIRDTLSLRRVTWGLMIAGAFMGTVVIVQQVSGSFASDFAGFGMIDSGFETGEISTQGEVSQPRFAGPIGEKNRFGQVMLVLVALGVGFARAEKPGRLRKVVYLMAALSAAGSALTFSRGNAVAFVLLLVVMKILGSISSKQLTGLFLAAFGLLLLLPQYRTRLMTIPSVLSLTSATPSAGAPDGAILGRATEVIAAVLVFVDHPVLGVGPGQFASYSQEYGNPLGLRRLESAREAHTLFPHIAAEGGLLGFLPFCAVLGTIMIELFRRSSREGDPLLAGLSRAYFLAISANLMCGLFLHMAFIRYFWLLLGVASAAASIDSRKRPLDPIAKLK
ncbi:MAG: O-antigen ligase family protein [bacterium]|nr:O-antigen ligase family protein [bacterium]